jgi:hypothetical protein
MATQALVSAGLEWPWAVLPTRSLPLTGGQFATWRVRQCDSRIRYQAAVGGPSIEKLQPMLARALRAN